ncbi:MAG TPA: HlyD family type I secretion periplasmic adaptor subunit [Inquilinus sp.]|nr:HlyD family type I secretion periplasmic adaptor subunit [Inquilinus sp.]
MSLTPQEPGQPHLPAVPGGPLPSASRDEDAAALRQNARRLNRVSLIGGAVIAVFVVGFGVWAAFTPLAAAAVATGMVSPEGNKRTVQHLEGGIIRELAVRDGDEVKAGDTLLVLDATRDKATYDMVRMQRLAAVATIARLDAEQSGAAAIAWPEAMLNETPPNPVASALVKAQQDQFVSRRESIVGQKSVLAQRIAQSRSEIVGLKGQIRAADTQLELIQQEIDAVAPLVEKGLERRPRLLQLQRGQAQLAGQKASNLSSIAKAEQTVGESEMRMLALDSDFRDKVASERAKTQKELAALEERLRSSGDVVVRTRIVAPLDGTVTGRKFHTVGGVVAPGAPILEIVPKSAKVVLDVQVQPNDIDVVREGQPALVRFVAYSHRNVPRVAGRLIYVAANSTLDEKTGRAFFLAKIEVDPSVLKQAAPTVVLSAGTPAEVSITTGSRTVLDYAFDPLLQTFR